MGRWTYDLELTRADPAPVTERWSAVDAAGAEAVVSARADGLCCVRAVRRAGEGSGGEFHVWITGDRTLLRCGGDGEWHAMDPAWASAATAGDLWFRDVDGSAFPAQNGETVPRSRAFEALSLWLRTDTLLPGLQWV